MNRTDLDVCNSALQRVGAETIDALDEETPAGAFCLNEYPQCKHWLLSRYRWSFANKIAALTRIHPTPDDCPRAFAFALPTGLIGAIHAYRRGAKRNSGNLTAEMVNGYIAADAPCVWAEFTADKPESTWPPSFAELVRVTFAMGLAAGPKKDQSLAATLQQIAFGTAQEQGQGGLFAAAISEDSRNAPPREAFQTWDDGALVNARYNGWPGADGWGNPFVIPPGVIGPICFIAPED